MRLSALYLGLFALCAVALVFYVTAISEGMQRDRTQSAIADELRIVAGAYRRGGVARPCQDHRAALAPARAANLYAIAMPTGDLIAGNIAALQPGVLDREGWTTLPFRYQRNGDTADEQHRALAQVVFLPNGMRLMVGRDIGEREQVRGLVRQALVIALAIMFRRRARDLVLCRPSGLEAHRPHVGGQQEDPGGRSRPTPPGQWVG